VQDTRDPTDETLRNALAPCRGQAILTLRALHQRERFERAWQWLSSTYQRTVEIPENVVLFPKRTVHWGLSIRATPIYSCLAEL